MGSGERSGKFLGLGQQDDDSSYRCTKKTMHHHHHRQFQFSETEIPCFGDGGNGTSAGGPIFINSAPLTATQRQEFERQSLIYKYMMASVPVPPQLLIPLPKTQSYRSGSDLKCGSGSDPEPWRCRRTDGKKWRCSRDVLPEQKYCERHAHKNKPRSRKPVEIQSQKNSGNHQNYALPSFQFPPTDASCDQNRCNEWFGGGGNTCNQQKQQFILSPPSTFIGNNAMNMNTLLYRPELSSSNEQGFVSPNPYLESGVGQGVRIHQLNDAFLNHNVAFPQGSLYANAEINSSDVHSSLRCNKSSLFSDRKLPFCSFRLSVPGDEDNRNQGVSIGMLGDPQSHQSSSSVMPGGPLGEALCVGAASSNLPSPRGYSNSSGTSS